MNEEALEVAAGRVQDYGHWAFNRCLGDSLESKENARKIIQAYIDTVNAIERGTFKKVNRA